MRKPTLLLSLVPVLCLVALIIIGVRIFGEDITGGASQIALFISSLIVIGIAMLWLKTPWKTIEDGITLNLTKTGSAIFILLMIGALTATWMLSGIVPTIIYYGLELISPKVFLLVTFLLTSLVSVLSGSSWTTVGTIGVAMMGAGSIIGIHPGWLAGAIISGAYFGDKRSPMSDTCNLSASVAQVDLYKHINYLLYTNLPSFLIAGLVFAVVGFVTHTTGELDLTAQFTSLSSTFVISPWLLLIPCFTIFMIVKKISPFITLFSSAIIGGVVAFVVQPQIIDQVCAGISGGFDRFVYFMLKSLSSPVSVETGNDMLNTLACTKGMHGMLNTVWLIMCVVAFGGTLEASGMINTITEKMARALKSTVGLVSSTIGTCIFCNITLSDQYMSIVVPGNIFADTYRKRGYAPELLSRTLEDSATVTSVLVPWNTCGVVQSTVLGIATMSYLPYCIFNIVSPIMSIFVAAIGWKIHRIPVENDNQ